MKVIEKKIVTYKDSFTEYLQLILTDFNFKEGEKRLQELGKICDQDYFLHSWKEKIIECAKALFFETYIKIFSIIDIKIVA